MRGQVWFKENKLQRNEKRMGCTIRYRAFLGSLGVVLLLFQSSIVYGVPTPDGVHELTMAVRQARLPSLYIPVGTDLKSDISSVAHNGGMVTVELKNCRLIESTHRIQFDEPSEIEPVLATLVRANNASLYTYLLPGGSVQRTLSLAYDDLNVTIVPKWITKLPKNSFVITENDQVASSRDIAKLVALAKTLHQVRLDL